MVGQAASMGALLLAGGAKDQRFSLPNARIMVHQPSGGAQGSAADIEIQAKEILYLRQKLNELFAMHTGQAQDSIERDIDRDRFMSADEAVTYGIIDKVIQQKAEVEASRTK